MTKKRTSASRARSESRSRSRAGIVRARTAARGCKFARQVSAPVSPLAADTVWPRFRRARASVTTWCKISTFFWTSYCSNNLFVLALCSHPKTEEWKNETVAGAREKAERVITRAISVGWVWRRAGNVQRCGSR